MLARLFLSFLNVLQHLLSLLCNASLTAGTSVLNAPHASLSLFTQQLSSGLLSLLLVNELHEDALVLEAVTLSLKVQLGVQVLANLLGLPVLPRQPPQDPHAANPQDLRGYTGNSLSVADVTAFAPGCSVFPDAGAGVDLLGLADDQTILDKLPDVLAGVSIGNLVGLIGILQDFIFSTC